MEKTRSMLLDKGLPMLHIVSYKIHSPYKIFSVSNILFINWNEKIEKKTLLSVQTFHLDNHTFFEFHYTFFVVKDEPTHTTILTGLVNMVSTQSFFLNLNWSIKLLFQLIVHPLPLGMDRSVILMSVFCVLCFLDFILPLQKKLVIVYVIHVKCINKKNCHYLFQLSSNISYIGFDLLWFLGACTCFII